MNRGLLIAAAGTSSVEASEVFCRFDGRLAERFDGVSRYWAYTSGGVRRKLAARGQQVDDPGQALRRMREEGVTHAAVQSLHMAPGSEYTELCEAVLAAAKGEDRFDRVSMSQPLLSCTCDFNRIVAVLLESIPADSARGEAVLFVAHGSRFEAAREAYAAADAACRRLDRLVFLATMMPQSNMEEMVRVCRAARAGAVYLVPFMIAAGYSACNEIAGTGADTWQTAIEAAGMRCCPVLKGLGDYAGVVDVWLDQTQLLLNDLERG